MIAELRHRAAQVELRPRTIFVGGGTPTLMRAELWERLLGEMRRSGVLDRVEEFTVEANPETVTPELMNVLVAGGVNRVSIGAQSFQPPLLKMLERWHEPANVGRAVETVRAAGIENVNLDLIFAVPGQTMETLRADLDAALALRPDHLSYYGLTYEPNTAMTQRLKMHQFEPADEDTERAMYEAVLDRLDTAGFEQYEVSNWAKRGAVDRRCQHNLAYWTNRNWLGIGPAAASHIDGRRWKNRPHLGRYLDSEGGPPIVDFEHLPEERRVGEELMLRLRLREGVPRPWLEQHLPRGDQRWRTINELTRIGMMEDRGDRLVLTRRGLFVADAVIGKLL